MEKHKQLEQKLEELIQQLNKLLVQLSKENDVPVQDEKTVENISSELQRIQKNRIAQPTDQIKEGMKNKDKNGWNYEASYMNNRF